MTEKTRRYLLIGLIAFVVIALLVTGAVTGAKCQRGCAPPAPVIEVDAGPLLEETLEKERAAEVIAQERLREVENEHAAQLDALDEAERREFDRVRQLSGRELDSWLKAFDAELRTSSRS